MKPLLEFMLGKLDVAVNEKDRLKFYAYRMMCEDCFFEVMGNRHYDGDRARYRSILDRAKGLYSSVTSMLHGKVD